MSEYVSRVELEVNGLIIDDFQSVEEGEIETAKAVHLVNKTGSVQVTPRHTVQVEYVVPADKAEYDFTQVIGGRLTIDRMNGTRITYMGVTHLKTGKASYDGDKEAKRTIEFTAEKRIKE